MEQVSGIVENIVYANEKNGYTVCEIETETDPCTVVGYLPFINPGEHITAFGTWTSHPEYGQQFKADYYEKVPPKTEDELIKYLSSGILPGIGKSTATKIVEKFGENALEIIERTPDRLLEIKGLSKKKIENIFKKYIEYIGVRDVVMFLQKFGVGANLAVRVYKLFGAESVARIQKNPYILSDRVDGITFTTADKMSETLGFPRNFIFRLRAGIRHILNMGAMQSGHTYLPKALLLNQTAYFLNVEMYEVESALLEMLDEGLCVREDKGEYDVIYLKFYHSAEKNVAAKLLELSSVMFDCKAEELDSEINKIEDETGIVLAEKQRQAIHDLWQTSVFVITGGPGTGKTTIINTIIKLMEKMNKNVLLGAPTGRAAKRMSEITGVEAKTIHRLLEIGFSDDDFVQQFFRNEENPLDADIIIIDEVSMVDILLMNSLLKAVSRGTRVVLVGDSDQLPSVGAGNVLRDIIESGSINCIKLTEIFRQAQESMIIVNAHMINKGEYPACNEKDKDFFLVKRDDPGELCDTIVDLCVRRLPNSYDIDKFSQIQVLTPTKKTAIGTMNLNKMLQDKINPFVFGKAERMGRNNVFRVDDKVMQIKNNYQTEWKNIETRETGVGVFNGDVGFVRDVDLQSEKLTVHFDEREVVYDFNNLDELELAYAVTVHKAQGSEFDVVVMPMFEVHNRLMVRNLFYTAVTRAKRLVVLVGREEIIRKFVDNNNEQVRFSALKEKLIVY